MLGRSCRPASRCDASQSILGPNNAEINQFASDSGAAHGQRGNSNRIVHFVIEIRMTSGRFPVFPFEKQNRTQRARRLTDKRIRLCKMNAATEQTLSSILAPFRCFMATEKLFVQFADSPARSARSLGRSHSGSAHCSRTVSTRSVQTARYSSTSPRNGRYFADFRHIRLSYFVFRSLLFEFISQSKH